MAGIGSGKVGAVVMESSDRELIERVVRQGDEAAFEELVRRHHSQAYQVAYGVLFNREDAEDVTLEAFARVHRALSSFRGDCEFSTWIYRIVMNLARNRYRWNKVRGIGNSVSIDAPAENVQEGDRRSVELPDEHLAPDQQLAFEELQEATRRAMAELPASYREAVILRNIKNLSYEEIAELLDCKVGTVKSRIARGRELLRESLQAKLS